MRALGRRVVVASRACPPASGSRPRRRGSSTSAGRARRCTTGPWPGGSAGAFVLRIEDTDEARNRPEWTQGIIDALAWIGIGADDPTFEGPYFQSANAAAPRRRRRAAVRRRAGVLLRPDRRADPGAGQGVGPARLRRVLARPRPRPGARPGAALPGARRGRRPSCTTSIRGEVVFEHDTIEDFVLLRGNGTPLFLLANVVDDIEMGITHVVRGEEHLPNTPEAAAAVGGARPRAAGVGARAGARQRAAQEAVEAARQGGARGLPRRGLPRRRRWSTT